MHTTTTTRPRRDLMVEGDLLPTSVEDLAELRQAILDAGHPEQVANAICGWLIGKRDGPDGLAADTRSRYRRILAAVSADNASSAGALGFCATGAWSPGTR